MKIRYSELDAIRGIAAIFVVLYHYTVQYGAIFGFTVAPFFRFEFGKYGVELFFIVSGFVIFLTLNKTTNPYDFIVSRFSRLYPAYWAAVILTFTVATMAALPNYGISLKNAFINLSMLQKFVHVPPVDGVYWTLVIELSFYIVMFIFFLTKQLKNITAIALLWLFIIISLNFIEQSLGIHLPSFVRFILMLTYGNLFIAGIMFYKIMHEKNLIHYLILLIALLTEYYLRGAVVWHVLFYYVLFFLFTSQNLKFLAMKPLVYLGTISYSLYLIHQNIGYVVIQWLESHDMINAVSAVLVPLVIVVIIAILMQKYIEKPALIFIRRKWQESNFHKRIS